MGEEALTYGTSFASPLVAGVASLIWSTNHNLKNTDVERILRASCENSTSGRNAKFGYGMPDAAKAVRIANSYAR